MDFKIPDFSLICESIYTECQGLTRNEESDSFFKGLLSNKHFQTALCATLYASARKFGVCAEGGFRDEEEMVSSLCSRGVSGPLMDLCYFGYLVGKKVGESQSLENMFQEDKC